MKLLNILKKKPFCNEFHLILIPIILLILSLKYYFIFIFLLLYLFYIFKRTKLILPVLLFILTFILVISIKKIISISNSDKTEYNCYISDIVDENTFDVYSSGIKIRCYLYNHNYHAGNVIYINGDVISSNKSYSTDFSYTEYLNSIGIDKYIKVTNSNLIYDFRNIKDIKNNYISYLKDNVSSESYDYILTMVFQKNNIESNVKEAYSILGISHILAISGFHIMFLYSIISFILLKLFKYYKKLLPLIIIGLYIYLIGISYSSLRSFLFLVILSMNKGKIKYLKLDILSLSLLLILFFNPFAIYNTGLILSFLVSFILIFASDIINTKSSLLRKYILYILIFLVTLPFVISISGKISLLSLLISPIISFLIGYILIPISYVITLFPILDFIFRYVFIFINYYVINLSSYSILIPIMEFNIYMKILYYVFLCFMIVFTITSRNVIIFTIYYFIYLLSIIFIHYINPVSEVIFLDVGQGDSAFIRLANNRGTMLIDAYNAYDYLIDSGIARIDYLVITHSDSDHTGDYLKIINNIDVKNIIYPKYDTKTNELFSTYDNSYLVDYTNSFYLDDVFIDILSPIYDLEDVNNNSIVLSFEIANIKYLFVGDIESKAEEALIEYYGTKLKSDVLKVGHHGSNTSSTKNFIDLVSPTYSIISAGLNNKYNFPSSEVLARLNKSKIYITYECGNITFSSFMNKNYISTYV